MIFAVAPFAGAWIEILKLKVPKNVLEVAPFAGAWIEISTFSPPKGGYTRRSLRGSVD